MHKKISDRLIRNRRIAECEKIDFDIDARQLFVRYLRFSRYTTHIGASGANNFFTEGKPRRLPLFPTAINHEFYGLIIIILHVLQCNYYIRNKYNI